MSNEQDDDIWARVKADAQDVTARAQRVKIAMEPSQFTHGQLKTQPTPEHADKLSWETTGIELDALPPRKRRKRSQNQGLPKVLIGSIIVALLWVLTVGVLLIENANKFGVDGSTFLANVLMLLLGPALALLAGFMGEGIAKNNREMRHMVNAARRMLEPETNGEVAVRTTASAVRSEIERLEDAVIKVAERLSSIESNIEGQTKALALAGQDAHGGANKLINSMESERERLNNLLAAMADLTNQAQVSTQTAAQGIEDRAARLAMVAEELVGKSTIASDVASQAAQRLDQAAVRAVSAIEQLDKAANRGETALARAHDLMVLARLRADEAVASVETAVSSLSDAATGASEIARAAAQTVSQENEATRDAGLAHIEEVRAAAISNAAQITQALRAEAEAAQLAGSETLAALKASADAVRFAAAEVRSQASEQLTENQRRLDGVRQSAFEVGKDADAFLEKRLADAKELIEKSASLLDDTGGKIQDRFARLAASCADQARAVEDLLDGLDRRLSDLPEEAQARARAIELALDQTLSRLTEAGRKAAEETAALDGAFQDRLRDSYSALGEVVQRLGGLSGVLPSANPRPVLREPLEQAAPIPQPSPQPPPNMVVQPPAQSPSPIMAVAPVVLAQSTLAPSPAIAPNAPTPAPVEQNLAPVQNDQKPAPKLPLKITSPIPVEDDPFAELHVDRQESGKSAETGNWSWKQVLSTLDAKGEKNQAGRIGHLVAELGLEASIDDVLLDRLRVLASRSRDQARRGTRELATEPVRAMRRKLTTDPDLRANLVRFVESRREAAARGRLAGNEARVYLVTDAALEA